MAIEINETKPVEASLVVRLTGDDSSYFKSMIQRIAVGDPPNGNDLWLASDIQGAIS